MSENAAAARIHAYVVENFMYMSEEATIDLDESLLQSGIIDSMGIAELIQFVEDAFDVTIPDRDVTEANFATLRAIARLVARRSALSSVA